MPDLNQTHDATARSFVASANQADTDFPLQNLPLGVFSRPGETATRCGVRIGDEVLDLQLAFRSELLADTSEREGEAALASTLAPLMALGGHAVSALRARVFGLLAAGQERQQAVAECLVPEQAVTMSLPVEPRNFTDFLTSSFHKTRLAAQPRLDPNFMSLPLAYHSRASSVRISGGEVIRPHVQYEMGSAVRFGPTREMDFELELGAFIGRGNALGQPISIHDAPDHLFGYCLLNDWSVRDVQRWESKPLGPFLAKSLSTTVSPWIVTEEALRPFRTGAFVRPPGDMAAPGYLQSDSDGREGGLGIELEAWLLTPHARASGECPVRVTATDARHLYWTFAQMVTHHASNGCNLLPGDLFGSGTVSGPSPDSRACLAELTERGAAPLSLPGREVRTWLEDGDEVVLRGRASRQGFVPIGFGECRGAVAAARPWPTREADTSAATHA